MYSYYCYGLNIRSEIEIPEFLYSEMSDADVEVRYGDKNKIKIEHSPEEPYALRRTSEEITLWMDKIGGLQTRRGRDLVIAPAEEAGEGFRFLVAGVGMGLILYQRGVSSLHGSAVSIDGQAVGFVGWKGMGKSTTAGVFHSQGYPVITDDVLPFHVHADSVLATPSFPHLKLFPDTIETALAENPEEHLRIDPKNEKRGRAVAENFPRRSVPLRCIYVLDWGERDSDLESTDLTGRDACLELLRHSFSLRMFKSDGATPKQLDTMSQLADRVPVRKLKRPPNLEKVKQIPPFVKRDLQLTNSLSTVAGSS